MANYLVTHSPILPLRDLLRITVCVIPAESKAEALRIYKDTETYKDREPRKNRARSYKQPIAEILVVGKEYLL